MINNRDKKEKYMQIYNMYMVCLFPKGGVIARGNLFLESPVNRDTEDTS